MALTRGAARDLTQADGIEISARVDDARGSSIALSDAEIETKLRKLAAYGAPE